MIKILYGFDTESPFGSVVESEKGKRERVENLDLIKRINKLMNDYKVGRTFFMLGAFLEQSIEQLGIEYVKEIFEIENPLVELGNHTYKHSVIAEISTRPDKKPISLSELVDELDKTNSLIRKLKKEDILGLRTPLGYSKNLPEQVADVIKKCGFCYVSSNLRDKEGGINAPLVEDGEIRQPFVYDNGLVEIPSHGWQDTVFTGASKTKGVKNYPKTIKEIFEHYKKILSKGERLANQTEVICIGLCLHPQAIKEYDPDLEVLNRLLEYSSKKGFKNGAYMDVL